MIETWAAMSNPNAALEYGSITSALLGVSVLGWLWWAAPKERLSMPGNGPDKPKGPTSSTGPVTQTNTGGPNQVFSGSGPVHVVNQHPAPSRDPNAIYQYGRPVGAVVGAVVHRNAGSVQFAEMYGIGQLNAAVPFEYQDLLLKADDALLTKRTMMGFSKTGTMQHDIVQDVVALIVGAA